jgi:hypothetical protein
VTRPPLHRVAIPYLLLQGKHPPENPVKIEE